jgi:muramoyltetrapeptide carboxypeptidase
MPEVVDAKGVDAAVEAHVDTIAIFAPGGYEADTARFHEATRYFEARGARVVTKLKVDRHHDRFSGTDDERLSWLHDVIEDGSIGIAIAQRGGYGATRLLPHIDFAAMAASIRRDGKRFVGHSDFTAISLGLLATTGAISFAGPMASFGFGNPPVEPFTEEHFWQAMREARVEADFATPFEGNVSARGILWGGNLSMLTSLVGTPWMPAIDGGVLFIEDINEQPYRIERMLLQLKQAGILDRQKLILCGDISGVRVADYDRGYDVDSALDYVQSITSVPIVRGLPFGHIPRKLTLAVGATAEVEVAGGHCHLHQRWDLLAT